MTEPQPGDMEGEGEEAGLSDKGKLYMVAFLPPENKGKWGQLKVCFFK